LKYEFHVNIYLKAEFLPHSKQILHYNDESINITYRNNCYLL